MKQTESLARDLGCYQELFVSPPSYSDGSHPDTPAAWMAKARVGIAYTVVWHHISPEVAAYMRVLGYNRIGGRDAAELYRKAQCAARRIHKVYSVTQTKEEVSRMITMYFEMLGDYQVEHYMTVRHHNEARKWLGKMLRRKADRGDQVVADCLKSWETRWEQRTTEKMQLSTSSASVSNEQRDAEKRDLTQLLVHSISSMTDQSTQSNAGAAPSSLARSRYPTPLDEADVKPEPPGISL